jgi:hypothetical protein
MYTADRRLYLNAEGKVVEADDPTRASLLVGQGGTLPLDQAQRLGLVDAEEKAAKAPANKAKAPVDNKGA